MSFRPTTTNNHNNSNTMNKENTGAPGGYPAGLGTAMQRQPPHNPPPPPPHPYAAVVGETALEVKLHGVAARMRQSRDAAHRSQQIAQERLRLVQAEVAVVQDAVRHATEHLHTLRQQRAEVPGALETAHATVQHTSKEYDFQHAELLYKQGQLKEQRALYDTRAVEREKSLANLRALVHSKRQQLAHANATTYTMATLVPRDILDLENTVALPRIYHVPPTALVDAWTDHAGLTESYQAARAHRWAQWIRAAARDLDDAARAKLDAVAQLERVVDGYHDAYPSLVPPRADDSEANGQSDGTAAAFGPPPDATDTATSAFAPQESVVPTEGGMELD